ncbi:hypothetical protein NQ176_g4734 [Zarea fungicola]|uniref:Uncharacterized protein n=1 Tax=Zarea fungicola TaxID=93591 RepID=A0ACC1NBZ2_9HYPO|nr:hypothetical protein NQ176_g4734 [Lecanicillium fungicola]
METEPMGCCVDMCGSIRKVSSLDQEYKHLFEKRIHKEEHEGQEPWIAMVEAEEKCIAKHKANNATRNQNTENDKKNSDKA